MSKTAMGGMTSAKVFSASKTMRPAGRTLSRAAPARDALAPVHPGEILREEFLAPLGWSAPKAAARLGVPRTRIERLAREETAMTSDTALRLGKLFKTSAEFWMNLQTRYDLLTQEAVLGDAWRQNA